MGKARISFTLNSDRMKMDVDPGRSLLRVLRDDLRLTGTKEGCDGGECGTCTVLLDGKAAMSCLIPMEKVTGKSVVTIEGLGNGGHLHPLQEAFIKMGAVQCGYCTPGMILESKALLESNPSPTRTDVVRRLSRHLCRCTGYVKPIEAVLYAAQTLRGGYPPPARGDEKAMDNPEMRDKVTGQAKYTDDLAQEGMLYVKVLRSPHPHANILHVDTHEAERTPGVALVVTGKDTAHIVIPSPMSDEPEPHEPLLALGKVYYQGQAVAAVVAESQAAAQEAIPKIRVRYQPLPAVANFPDAFKEDIPSIHSNMPNVRLVQQLLSGDVEQGFAQSAVVVENTYTTQFQEHACLEMESYMAYWDEEGRLSVCATTQYPDQHREALARALGLDVDMVRMIAPRSGGGFGSREEAYDAYLVAYLCHRLKKPVKLTYTREEVFSSTTKRTPFQMRLKTGATEEGNLTSLEMDMVIDSGPFVPYASGRSIPYSAVVLASGPYTWPHARMKVYTAFTNTAKMGSCRGQGGPMVAFAVESQMEIMAQKLGMDPLAFRLHNAWDIGSRTISGQTLTQSIGVKPMLEALRPNWEGALQWAKSSDSHPWLKRGLGLACIQRGYTYGARGRTPEAYVELLPDGQIGVLVGTVDIGQGTTALANIAAQEMGSSPHAIAITLCDTARTPYGGGTTGSKQTYGSGNAIKSAAKQLKEALKELAGEILEEKAEMVQLGDGYAFSTKLPHHRIPFSRLYQTGQSRGLSLKFKGNSAVLHTTPLDKETGQGTPFALYSFQAQVAEVEVNIKTGEVNVKRLTSTSDIGKVVNPTGWEGQVEGGAVQALGYALMEEFTPGQTRNFKDYRLPKASDSPEFITILVEDPVASGPMGAKGGGEMTMMPGAPAIINAIAYATGARLFSLPATPQRLLKSMGIPQASNT